VKKLSWKKIILIGEKDELEENNKQLSTDKHRLLAEVRLLWKERDNFVADVHRISQETQKQLSEVEPILKEADTFGRLKADLW
jgi:predicted transcriptional regulator